MEPATKPMQKEAAEAGFYKSSGLPEACPRMQLLNVEELLAEKQLLYPRMLDATFKKAPKVRPPVKEKHVPLAFDADEGPF